MATYVQLESEVWWRQEYEPPALREFNETLRAFYGLTRSECGSKGDNNHMRGRHRSMAWALNSAFCTDRSYGTRDARDKSGDPNALRATDCGIAGQKLWDASHRLDAAVRAGRLPCVAEWFGSFDGRTVVGWFEGHPSTSDDSHLGHLHAGIWTSYTNNAEQLQLLASIITGTEESDMGMVVQWADEKVWWATDLVRRRRVADSADLRTAMKASGVKFVTLDPKALPAGWDREQYLTAWAGPVDSEGAGGLVAHTHDGGETGPAKPE